MTILSLQPSVLAKIFMCLDSEKDQLALFITCSSINKILSEHGANPEQIESKLMNRLPWIGDKPEDNTADNIGRKIQQRYQKILKIASSEQRKKQYKKWLQVDFNPSHYHEMNMTRVEVRPTVKSDLKNIFSSLFWLQPSDKYVFDYPSFLLRIGDIKNFMKIYPLISNCYHISLCPVAARYGRQETLAMLMSSYYNTPGEGLGEKAYLISVLQAAGQQTNMESLQFIIERGLRHKTPEEQIDLLLNTLSRGEISAAAYAYIAKELRALGYRDHLFFSKNPRYFIPALQHSYQAEPKETLWVLSSACLLTGLLYHVPLITLTCCFVVAARYLFALRYADAPLGTPITELIPPIALYKNYVFSPIYQGCAWTAKQVQELMSPSTADTEEHTAQALESTASP